MKRITDRNTQREENKDKERKFERESHKEKERESIQ